MDKTMGCRSRHCERTCWAWAVRDIQSLCDAGMGMDAAARKWAETGLKHKDGEEILADAMGIDNLDEIRVLLREKGK